MSSGVKRLLRALGIAPLVILTSAHIGTDTAIYDGNAGPYSVRVVIRPPSVIPGVADVSVRVEGEGVDHVTVQPFQWNAGPRGAPPPDTAAAVPGDEELYSAELWLMTRSSYNVQVRVTGSRGRGTVMVPLNAVATETLEMGTGYGLMLAGMGLFLFVGAVTIVGAAVRESVLPPGEEPGEKRRVRSRIVMGVSAVLLGGLIFFGGRWWDAVEAQTRSLLYRPPLVESYVFLGSTAEASGSDAGPSTAEAHASNSPAEDPDRRILTLEIVDEDFRNGRWTPLVPDHGKLMHMWVVNETLASIAHLHPVRRDSIRFDVAVPEALSRGTYRLYADITHESGFAQTLVDTVSVPPPGAGGGDRSGSADGRAVSGRDHISVSPDPDDSWFVASSESVGSTERPSVPLGDGSTLTWVDAGTLDSDVDTTLVFRVTAPDGEAAVLESYMGMVGHAAVSKPDGSVFAHLHPVGTISMAARQTFELRSEGDTLPGSVARRMAEPPHETEGPSSATGMSGGTRPGSTMPGNAVPRGRADQVSFPFAFPESGEYRMWIQVQREERVLTGAFDVDVH